jgi:uncharacterized repeat protein (TIGR03803 family)
MPSSNQSHKHSSGLPVLLTTATLLTLLIFLTVSAQAQTFSVLHTFTGADGGGPASPLDIDPEGNLYGATAGGGNEDTGVVFKLTPEGTETVLTTWTGNAGAPGGPLPRGPLGSLFGTTSFGGMQGGTVFTVFPDGVRVVLYDFGEAGPEDGTRPNGVLLDDGIIYGTTSAGGASGLGTVFRLQITPRSETILYSFTGKNGDGATPQATVIRDADGNLYGTTPAGGLIGGDCGLNGCGTVFKIDSSGKETILYSFTGGADGGNPEGGLIRGALGDLFGTTTFGGSGRCDSNVILGCGTVFRLDTTGKETVLHTFTGGMDGSFPESGLIRDRDGNFYGTTLRGGGTGCGSLLGCGTVFELDSAGKETILYRFQGGSDGEIPDVALVRDSAGNLYGSASQGADTNCDHPYGCGTIFKITP